VGVYPSRTIVVADLEMKYQKVFASNIAEV
jgi:hypothetical protein